MSTKNYKCDVIIVNKSRKAEKIPHGVDLSSEGAGDVAQQRVGSSKHIMIKGAAC